MTNPDRVAFTLFGRDIYWYGVLMALGILVATLLASRESKRKKLPQDTILDLCLIVIPCGVVGARLYYVLFELERYLANPISILYIWEGGLAIYGAVIGGLLGAVIYAKKKKLRFLKLADCIAPGLVLAQAIGRWGNFFNQEAYGLPVTNEALMWFPMSVKIDAAWRTVHYFDGAVCDNPYHLATFFYESLWCFLVFLFLWSRRKKFKHDGDVFFTYVILYSFERMFVEGLRGDSLWLIPGMIRVSQLLSAVLFVAGIAFFVIRAKREKKLGALCWPAPEPAAAEAAAEEAVSTDADGQTQEQPEDAQPEPKDEQETEPEEGQQAETVHDAEPAPGNPEQDPKTCCENNGDKEE